MGELENRKLCSAEGVDSESNGENWVNYAMIRYEININSMGGKLLIYKLYRLAKMNEVIW